MDSFGYLLGVLIGATIKNLPAILLILWFQARDRRKLQAQIDELVERLDG